MQDVNSGFTIPPYHISVPTSATRTNLYYLELKTPGANLPGNTLSTDEEVLAAGGVLVASVHHNSTGLMRVIYNSNTYGEN